MVQGGGCEGDVELTEADCSEWIQTFSRARPVVVSNCIPDSRITCHRIFIGFHWSNSHDVWMILLVTFELFCFSWSWSGPRPGFFPRMMLIYVFGKAFGLSFRGFSKAETRFRPSSCRRYARVKESWRSCPSARRRTTEHMFPDSGREYVSVCCVFVFLEPRTKQHASNLSQPLFFSTSSFVSPCYSNRTWNPSNL